MSSRWERVCCAGSAVFPVWIGVFAPGARLHAVMAPMWTTELSLKRCLDLPKVMHRQAALKSALCITFGSSDGTLDWLFRENEDGRFQAVFRRMRRE